MQYDAIIIGSGLAGLAAGAKLSKEGKRVLLIEQHNIVGGCATQFKRKGYAFKVSLHELNGLAKNEHLYMLYQDLNAFENLTFLKIPEFYRWVRSDMDIVIPDDADHMKDILIKAFPHKEKGIHKYLTTIYKIRDKVFRLPQKKVVQNLLTPFFPLFVPNVVFLDSIINDNNLKLVLLGNLLYYHDDPYTMSLIFFSVAQSSFFSGAHYIQGGSQKLSNYLAGLITSNGGEVLTRHLVTKIITDNGKAIGFEYKQNKNIKSEIRKVMAKYIIANAAVPNWI
jgi:phytoene dehydrogenase-like protein